MEYLQRSSLPWNSNSILENASPSCYPKMAKVECKEAISKLAKVAVFTVKWRDEACVYT